MTDPILTPERHPCIDHDERFKGVMFATNGCLACECEALRARAAELERGLADIAERLQTGGMTDVWFLAGQVKGLIEHVAQADQRAAEDAATIAKLRADLQEAERQRDGFKHIFLFDNGAVLEAARDALLSKLPKDVLEKLLESVVDGLAKR